MLRIAVVGVLLLSGLVHAQEVRDPIDQSLDTCLNSAAGASTAGQIDCAGKAYAAWDSELNKVYQKLMNSLDPPSRDLLRTSQRQWLTFRNAEKKFQAAPWRSKGGTLIGVSLNLDNVGTLRSRVMALRTYAAVAK